MPYGMVVVGTDGSDSALSAVERAAEISNASGAASPGRVRVQRDDPPGAGGRGGAARRHPLRPGDRRGGGGAALAAACKRAQDCGATRVESRRVEGDAVHVLLQLAEDRAADLIVVGNRGINTRLGRILGSVPSVVSQRAPCDVLIAHTVEGGKGV